MIVLKYKMDRSPNTLVEYQVSRDGRFGWFLGVWHPENNPVLAELVAEIRLEIRNSSVDSVSRTEAESWLKDFFKDLHWRMYGLLSKTGLQEKGLSLFFGVLFDHELIFVQFGRLFCSVTDSQKIKHIGANYRHHQIQTLSKMNLLGFEDKDMQVKVQRIFLEGGERFILLSGNLCAPVYDDMRDVASLPHLIRSFDNEPNPLWLILEAEDRLIAPHPRRLSRLQISSFILIFISLIAVLYIIFGNRFVEQLFHRTRLIVQSKKGLRLDQIPNTLAVDSQNVIRYMERIVNQPARDIELQIVWNATLDYEITAAPVFNLNTIFLTADNKLIAFNKKSRELEWKKSYPTDISSVDYVDNQLLVSVAPNQLFAYRDDGLEMWKCGIPVPSEAGKNLNPMRIGIGDDPRLDRPVMVFPSDKALTIMNGTTGESLSSITFTKELEAISAYDNFANCFYAVVDDALICIQLKILN